MPGSPGVVDEDVLDEAGDGEHRRPVHGVLVLSQHRQVAPAQVIHVLYAGVINVYK